MWVSCIGMCIFRSIFYLTIRLVHSCLILCLITFLFYFLFLRGDFGFSFSPFVFSPVFVFLCFSAPSLCAFLLLESFSLLCCCSSSPFLLLFVPLVFSLIFPSCLFWTCSLLALSSFVFDCDMYE